MDDTAAFTMRDLYDSRPLPTPTPEPEPSAMELFRAALLRAFADDRVPGPEAGWATINGDHACSSEPSHGEIRRRQQELLAPALDSYALDDVPPLRWMWPSLSHRPMTWAEACEAMRRMSGEPLAMAGD